MKKQEAIDDIENAIPDFILNDYQRGKETGLTYALELVEELDEPEKVVLSKEESEQDCCASAGGEFKDVKLDAVITDVEFGEPEVDEGDEDFGEYSMRNTVTLYHNQNPIAIADCEADAGNGGYYYSVCSLVIKNVHYKVVEA